jgi:hypothetical protein
MEKKEQINQNPVDKQQEEKLRVEETTPKTKKAEKGLSDDEKKSIVKMIQSTGTEAPVVLKPKPRPRPRKQIPKTLKEKILKLVRDGKPAVKVDKAKVVKKAEKKAALSEAEQVFILGLLRDTHAKVSNGGDAKLAAEQEIDFDQLNKQELVELLEEVVHEKDITLIKARVAKIKGAFYHLNKEEVNHQKQTFLADGGKEEDFAHVVGPLEKRFDDAFSIYRHNRAKHTEELEKVKQQNLKRKLEILDELKELIASEETLKRTYDEFKRLQQDWKEAGLVPVGELNNLWQNYHFLVEKFFDKVRINKELRDLDLKKNLEQKLTLCQKAEDLLKEKSALNSFKKLQQYHDDWREIGPVPREQKDEVWERFKAATDKINQLRREHYKDIHEEQEKNFEAKELLCDEAEKLIAEEHPASVREWQKATDKFNDLLNRWKSIGRAPRSKNDLIWKRFKTSLDAFYSNKRSFFSALKESQMENYSKKLALCEQAEAIKESSDWKKVTNELIGFQKAWKEIGPVPRKYSDKIWKRFRAACDEFFNRKSAFYKSNHKEEEDNLKRKEELVASMLDFDVKPDKEENLTALKDFQQQWLAIGHVPFHVKDKIYKGYHDAYGKLLEKMHLSQAELSSRGFKNKLEVFKKSPEGEHRMLRERSVLSAKMNKLKEDISLWENNIGFFSSGKASALVADFEKKIEQAKNDYELLKEKVKLIDREL